MKVLGWNRWSQPEAPQVAGTRKIVYASGTLLRFFLLIWSLRVRMIEVKEDVALANARKGYQVSESAGDATKKMRQWCSMGRTLLNIKLLVFNMGRANFREKILLLSPEELRSHCMLK